MLRKLMQGVFGLGLLAGLAGQVQAAQLEVVEDYGWAPPDWFQHYASLGSAKQPTMHVYVPDKLRPKAPLVVALHGCQQPAASYAQTSGWLEYAEKWGFAVLLPEQSVESNPFQCFNWFYPGFQSAEVDAIKAMIDHMLSTHKLDANRVYVTGLSAGAATAANLMATHPGAFAGGALHAGIAHGCTAGATVETAYDMAIGCMMVGVDKTPQQWGDLVRAASGDYQGPWPRVTIWQGGQDIYVVPHNQNELVEQWTNLHGTDQTADISNTVRSAEHQVYLNRYGRPVVETYHIPNLGHAQAVDPGAAAWECGNTGTFSADADICATYYMAWDFGLMLPEPPPLLLRDTLDLLRSLQ